MMHAPSDRRSHGQQAGPAQQHDGAQEGVPLGPAPPLQPQRPPPSHLQQPPSTTNAGDLRARTSQQPGGKKVQGVSAKGRGGADANKVCWHCTSKGHYHEKQAAIKDAARVLPGDTRLVINHGKHQTGQTACPFCKKGQCKKKIRFRQDAVVPAGFPVYPRCPGHA